MDKKNDKSLITMLGPESVFEGTISVPHTLRIDGVFKGKIETSGMLTIGNNAQVEATIVAKSALIGGKVKGMVMVEERVELESSSTLEGDLRTRDLIINEGALFHGKCSMKESQNG
jgi:cytoskeletal protein CcmA (bactofilin family)